MFYWFVAISPDKENIVWLDKSYIWSQKLKLTVPKTGIKVDNSVALRKLISWLIKLLFCSLYIPQYITINQIWISIANYQIFSV